MPSDPAPQQTSSSRQAAEVDEPHHTSFQPGRPPRISRGPIILLIVGASLELLSRLVPNTVGPRELMEQATSLVAFSFLSGSALWVIRQLGNIPKATRLVTAAACLVIVSQTLIVCDQLPFLDVTPVLGREGVFHELMENLPFPVGVILLLSGFLYAALEAQRARHLLGSQHQLLSTEFAERKRADKALRDSEEKYRHLFENLNDAALVADAETGTVLDANKQAEALLGCTREELIGMHQSDVHPADKHKQYQDMFAEHVAKGHAADYDGEIVRKDGSIVRVMISAVVLALGGKRLIVGLFRDITELKEMEEALRKSKEGLEKRVEERTAELERANEELQAEITERKRALGALRESEEELRVIADSVPGLFSYLGADGHYRFVNRRYEEWFGLSREEIVGKHYRDFIGEAAYELIRKRVDKALSGQRVRFEDAMPYARGGTRWIAAEYVPYADDRREIKGFFALVTDITDLKETEQALRESEERYRTLVETSPDAITLADLNGNIIVTNDRGAYLMGFDNVQELIASGKTVYDLIAPEDRERALENARKTLETGSVRNIEYRLLRNDGSSFPGEISASVVPDADGKPKAFIGVMRNITERREAEKALQESEEKYRHIVEDSIDAVGMAQEGKIIYVNDAFCKMFGYERDELVGQSILKTVAPEYRSLIEERNRLRLAGQEAPKRYVFTGVKKGGERISIGFSSSVRFMYKAKPTVLAILRDITEQRRAQERIRASLKEKELLLKEIQHRVKNNLQVISSLFDLQSRYTDDERVLTMFKESRDRVRSIALIHEKLYEAGDLTRIDFGEYIGSLATHLFRSYGVGLDTVKLKTCFDNVPLSIDAAIPCALIVNELVSNSLKHAFPSRNEGEIRLELRSGNDGNFTLVVGDNGVGLPKSYDISMPASLGLRLVTTLTRQLKGSIELGRDGGTTFMIVFPGAHSEAGVETNGTGTDPGR